MSLMNSNPSLMTAFLSYQQLGERSLDFAYLRRASNLTLNPFEVLLQLALSHRKTANSDSARTNLLMHETVNCVVDDEYEETPYVFDDEEEEEEDGGDRDDDDDRLEYTYSHPSSDGKKRDDDERWDQVHTKVAKLLWAIDMVAPQQQKGRQEVCSMRPACSFQISVRIDEKHRCFYYDCFEYAPCFVDADSSLPTKREILCFENTVNPEPTRQRYWSDDDDDQDDEELDQPVELRTDDEAQRRNAHAKALAGKFFNSRLFRIKISFDSIQGMLLRVIKDRNGQAAEDQTGVLILELSQPTNDFAVRSVASGYPTCNQFRSIKDWTEGDVASNATRHYIYASIVELQSFVTHLCYLDERLNAMMTPPPSPHPAKKPKKKKGAGDDHNKIVWGANNSMGGSDIAYSGSPQSSSMIVEGEKKGDASSGDSTAANLTPDQVEKLFKKTFGTSASNECLKAAVLRGHYRLDESITSDTVLYEGQCHCCTKTLKMTWGEALDQPTYAGLDYEDGGQNASVQCEDCGGNYLTSLCYGEPHFDSGKFHNHCTECPDFGVCISDYRNAHCQDCGGHYFCGLSGFECQLCGGGKAQLNNTMPSLSCWNGEVRGEEVAKNVLASGEEYGAALMRMAMFMQLGG